MVVPLICLIGFRRGVWKVVSATHKSNNITYVYLQELCIDEGVQDEGHVVVDEVGARACQMGEDCLPLLHNKPLHQPPRLLLCGRVWNLK